MNRMPIFGEYNIPVGEGLASSQVVTNASSGNNDDIQILLSPIGKIIENQWENIPYQYEHVELDEYIIMPNHIHGIIIISRNNKKVDARPTPTVSDVVCAFKSRCVVDYLRYIKDNNLEISGKIWQRSFYDHVIRTDRSLSAVRDYIAGNPVNWELDVENLLNL